MSGHYDPEETAYAENREEIIYHLDLEPDAANEICRRFGMGREDMCCDWCGEPAEWFVREIKWGGTSTQQLYCENCMPGPFIWLWEEWPWTPDDEL